jgi:hypothetical protein
VLIEDGSGIETDRTDEPVCPYCGHVMRDAWEIERDDAVVTCEGDGCGRDYHCSRYTTVTYTTSKK